MVSPLLLKVYNFWSQYTMEPLGCFGLTLFVQAGSFSCSIYQIYLWKMFLNLFCNISMIFSMSWLAKVGNSSGRLQLLMYYDIQETDWRNWSCIARQNYAVFHRLQWLWSRSIILRCLHAWTLLSLETIWQLYHEQFAFMSECIV